MKIGKDRQAFLKLCNTYRVVGNEYRNTVQRMFARKHNFDDIDVLINGDPDAIVLYFTEFKKKYNAERVAFLQEHNLQCDKNGYITTKTLSKGHQTYTLGDIARDVILASPDYKWHKIDEVDRRILSGTQMLDIDCVAYEDKWDYNFISKRMRFLIEWMLEEMDNINACLEVCKNNSDVLLDVMDAWNKYIA